jgi:guanidinopropionase
MTKEKDNVVERQPVTGRLQPRYAGIATFMKLPLIDIDDASSVDVGLVGVPWDGGTTNRPGARLAPREMRSASTQMRSCNHATGIEPYAIANCADLGDVAINPLDFAGTLESIEYFFATLRSHGIRPVTAGGDHLTTLPILRGLHTHTSVALVQFDAHSDTVDRQFGVSPLGHGTPFRRAVEEGLIDPKRSIMIGLRGGFYSSDAMDWAREQGFSLVFAEEARELGPQRLIDDIRGRVGKNQVYVTFDIDCLDPAYAPGTGTPEIGGLSTLDAQIIIRGLTGLDVVGADVVEVSPSLDTSGLTTLTGATFMWELLCVVAEASRFARAEL